MLAASSVGPRGRLPTTVVLHWPAGAVESVEVRPDESPARPAGAPTRATVAHTVPLAGTARAEPPPRTTRGRFRVVDDLRKGDMGEVVLRSYLASASRPLSDRQWRTRARHRLARRLKPPACSHPARAGRRRPRRRAERPAATWLPPVPAGPRISVAVARSRARSRSSRTRYVAGSCAALAARRSGSELARNGLAFVYRPGHLSRVRHDCR